MSSVCSEEAVQCVGVEAYIDPPNRTVFTEICGEDDISPEAMPTSPLRIFSNVPRWIEKPGQSDLSRFLCLLCLTTGGEIALAWASCFRGQLSLFETSKIRGDRALK